ncbi:hypothetical protein BRM1_13940 [Brevibacterium sp. BRM-1]|uniref:hypothetical protein n=1 Tax=Brevibacterium sp. BRM-1 TaxID=2999062 RepID=UPI0022815A1C|nr:hypothetical protein [Brevibacterium sp. BRM-1]WAL40298.1 hypothetical protein BRM1_13940 [Brevibacterium sp. BRM-1]
MESDYTRPARPPQRGRRRLCTALPILGLVLAVPPLVLSVLFSLQAVQYLQPLQEIGAADAGTKAGLIVMSSTGWLALAAAIVLVLVAYRRPVLRWRAWWSVAIVAVGLANPLAWALLGFV